MSEQLALDTKPEEWCAVVGQEGRYEVSDQGRVRSFLRRADFTTRWAIGGQPRILKQVVVTKGYLGVSICGGHGRAIRALVHRLVASAFIGQAAPGTVVRHLNGDPSDNRVVNLAYGTQADNCRDRARHGRTASGARNGRARISADEAKRILELVACGRSQASVAREFKVSPGHVWRIVAGREWRHHVPEVPGGTGGKLAALEAEVQP